MEKLSKVLIFAEKESQFGLLCSAAKSIAEHTAAFAVASAPACPVDKAFVVADQGIVFDDYFETFAAVTAEYAPDAIIVSSEKRMRSIAARIAAVCKTAVMFNSAPYGLFEGAGKRYIAICAPTPPIWKNLCIAMQREDLLENERYSDMSKRIENRYELVDIIQAWLSKYENASEAIEILRSHDVPCAEVKADWEMHECPQLASRHYFEDIPFPKSIVEETGRKQYKIKGLPFKTSSDAENPDYLPLPEVGEHNYDVYGTVATKEEIDALLDRWHNKFHKY